MNLPNKLTLLRIAIIPIFVGVFYLPFPGSALHTPHSALLYAASGVFILAYVTDAFDGYLARRRNQVTDFGKLMDPMADKLLTTAALIMLAAYGMIHPAAVIIILSREFIISALRLVCIEKGVVVAASGWGKLKTVSQAVSVPAVMVTYAAAAQFDWVPRETLYVADALVWISAVLAVISAVDYLYKNRKILKRVK